MIENATHQAAELVGALTAKRSRGNGLSAVLPGDLGVAQLVGFQLPGFQIGLDPRPIERARPTLRVRYAGVGVGVVARNEGADFAHVGIHWLGGRGPLKTSIKRGSNDRFNRPG
jgi:hypothetical protein